MFLLEYFIGLRQEVKRSETRILTGCKSGRSVSLGSTLLRLNLGSYRLASCERRVFGRTWAFVAQKDGIRPERIRQGKVTTRHES